MNKVIFRGMGVFFLALGLCLAGLAQAAEPDQASQDALIKSQVETAVSMLDALYAKHQAGEMSLGAAKELGADLLRQLRYGPEGYFWADTLEGVNVVLYGRADVEGKNRIDAQDVKGGYFVQDLQAAALAGGGYVEYWFPKKGESQARPKRSYGLLCKPFGWVVGTGYYR